MIMCRMGPLSGKTKRTGLSDKIGPLEALTCSITDRGSATGTQKDGLAERLSSSAGPMRCVRFERLLQQAPLQPAVPASSSQVRFEVGDVVVADCRQDRGRVHRGAA